MGGLSLATPKRWLASAACVSALIGCESASRDNRDESEQGPPMPSWTIGPQPILQIGLVAEVPGHDLSGVVDVALRDNGSLLVGDAASQEVRHFSENGQLLARAGRPGQGPGDLSFLNGVDACADGGFVARQPRRVTFFSADGAVERVMAAPDESGILLQDASGVDVTCAQVTWLTRGRVPFDSLGMLQQTNILTWTSRQDTVEVLRFSGATLYRTEWEGLPAMVVTPWMPSASWAVFDSMLVWTSGANDSLRVWHRGTGWRDMHAPMETRPVSDADRDGYRAYREASIAMNPPEARSLFPLDRLPSVPTRTPAITTLLPDGASRVWIRPYPDSSEGLHTERAPVGANGERWVVLDLETGELAAVRMPPSIRVLAVGADRIAGVREADDGAEIVVVYRLDRR